MDKSALEKVFHNHGFDKFKWIDSTDIVVSQWVRFKCMFGCPSYGKKGSCPPNVPSIAECREFFSEYSNVIVFHIEGQLDNPEDRSKWSREINARLLEVEREVFLSGYQKAFLLFMDECRICSTCTGSRRECNNLKNSRPGPESLGMDVFSTVKKCGFPIQVLKDFSEKMNRFAFLLVD